MRKNFIVLILSLLVVNVISYGQDQLMNLDPTANPRFTLTEKTWPEYHGQADVCLWNDDKVAATSVTIDDNLEAQHGFWRRRANDYNLKFTWFVIDELVTDWNNFQILHDEGHDVQAHDDRNWIEPDDGTNPSDAEYKTIIEQTKNAVNTNVTGANCMTYAYPFGDGNKAVAREVFISMRGVYGLMNQANETNYLELNSASTNLTDDTKLADAKHRIDVLLNPDEKLWNVSYYRGWSCVHFHTVSDTVRTDDYLSYISSKADEVWVAGYSEIARYSQSRDSHTLNVTGVTTSEVRFVLTDQMNDTYFNFPLTVKVRVNNTWTDATAVQNGNAVDAKLITHTDGNKYVFVKAVPDAGEITISGTVSAGSNTPPVLEPIGNQTVVEGETLNVNITANDADGNAMSISAANLPYFASLTDNGDGTAQLSVTPDYGDAGIYNSVSIAVDDGTDSDSEGIVITVDASSEQVVVVNSAADDGMVNDPSVSTVNNPYINDVSYDTGSGMKLGSSDNGGGVTLISDILVFELPERPAGKVVTGGELTVDINWKRQWVTGSFDLYGLPFSTSYVIAADMYYAGAFVAEQDGTFGLQDGFWTAPTGGAIETPGLVSSSTEVSSFIADYINTQFDNGAKAGDFVFVRLSPAEDYTDNGNFVFITSGNSNEVAKKPKLKLIFGDATAINKTDKIENVTIYPNPSTNGQFTVRADEFDNQVEISVLSIQGNILYRKSFSTSQEIIIDANLPAGTYIVTISNTSKVVAKKLVVR